MLGSPRVTNRDGKKTDVPAGADRSRESRGPESGTRGASSDEPGPEATALIDAASMEGLQARSRRGPSVPPPPPSDAQLTSVLDTNQLSELVDESHNVVPATRIPVASVAPAATVIKPRSKYTPTLRSADFEATKKGRHGRARIWPLVVGMLVFGAGVGTFMGARTLPAPGRAATIELVVQAQPPSATLRLDNTALAGSPHSSTHPRDGKRRTVIIDAPGYVSQQIDVVFDASTSIDVVLSKTDTRP